jgi:hypothetical protein
MIAQMYAEQEAIAREAAQARRNAWAAQLATELERREVDHLLLLR